MAETGHSSRARTMSSKDHDLIVAEIHDAINKLGGSARPATPDEARRALPFVFAIEVQALTVGTQSPLPRRTVSGFDVNRLHLLLAVLEKRADIRLGQADVFVNAVGGVRLDDPAADLAVALAIAGSKLNRTLPPACAVIGEVGLGGEVRRVARLDARLAEAAALGLEMVVVPANHRGHIPAGLDCRTVNTIRDAIRLLA